MGQTKFKELYLSSAVPWSSAVSLEAQRRHVQGVQQRQGFHHCDVQSRTLCRAHLRQRGVSEDAALETP